MSLQRIVVPPITSTSIFKFASSQPCHHLLRTFSSHPGSRMSSKRKMQTSTAYTPHTFNSPPPPPPRNTGIPDTSIAGPTSNTHMPQLNDTRPPPLSFQPTQEVRSSENGSAEPAQKVSLPEQEAQKSKSVENKAISTSSPSTSNPTPKPRPRLRARKAAMSLTPSAVSQLRSILSSPTPKLIKVGVRNRGCSGLAYHLEYVEKPGAFDEMVEQDGVKVVIDSKALMSIIGSEMDWVEDKLSRRFVFRNPNIKEQCGCGESFMV